MTVPTSSEGLASLAQGVLADGPLPSVTARVIDIQGFSTWSGDELVVVGPGGVLHGRLLGATGAAKVLDAAGPLLDSLRGAGEGGSGLGRAVVEVHGAAVAEAGLSCGGRAELLLQPTATIPAELWARLAARTPVALLTRIDGPAASAASLVLDGAGGRWGSLEPTCEEALVTAAGLLAAGHSASRRVSDPAGTVLVEAWVPPPRLVVVGAGELVDALRAQAALLGWDLWAVEDRPEGQGDLQAGGHWPALATGLAWAGGSAAVVVLSHDPHVDVPALAAALDADVSYLGAMGSRKTQSRRLERLVAAGRREEELRRIHRPIGLDLGGRSAPEVSLAICAEILACHCGRDARPLADSDGPINDRPVAVPSA
jgi:xanthine dehydrogenase accessory factor